MSTVLCTTERCKALHDISVLYCPNCNASLSAVSVQSTFHSDKGGSFSVLEKLNWDAVSTSFIVVEPGGKTKYILREYVPQPQSHKLALREFEEKAQLLERIRSHRIITPSKHFDHESRFYTVEDRPWDATLLSEMKASGSYLEDEVLEIAREVIGILQELHSARRPVHHGEISTTTVARRKDDRALLLMDFALLKDATQVTKSNGLRTIANRHLTRYQPVERRDGRICAATDVYTLGVMMCELLSGRRIEEIYDAEKRRWNWSLLNASESMRILLEAMTIRATKKRVQTSDGIWHLWNLIENGQKLFAARKYYEAIDEWKHAYKKAEAPLLKRKIRQAVDLSTNSVMKADEAASSFLNHEGKLTSQDDVTVIEPPVSQQEESHPAAGTSRNGEAVALEAPSVEDSRTSSSAASLQSNLPNSEGALSTESAVAPNVTTEPEKAGAAKRPLRQRLWAKAREHPWKTTIGALASASTLVTLLVHLILQIADKPPKVVAIRTDQGIVEVGGKITLGVDIDEPSSKKLKIGWTCTAGKIEGNESGNERIVRFSADVPELQNLTKQMESFVTVTAIDDYGKRNFKDLRITIVPRDCIPKVKLIQANKSDIRPGERISLMAVMDYEGKGATYDWKCEPNLTIEGQGNRSVTLIVDNAKRSSHLKDIKVIVTVRNECGDAAPFQQVIPFANAALGRNVKQGISNESALLNREQIINSLQATPSTVRAGEIVYIDAQAVGWNNDDLIWKWEPHEYIEGSGPNVRLNTSKFQVETHLTVTLTVTNVRGKIDSRPVYVVVKPAGDKKE